MPWRSASFKYLEVQSSNNLVNSGDKTFFHRPTCPSLMNRTSPTRCISLISASKFTVLAKLRTTVTSLNTEGNSVPDTIHNVEIMASPRLIKTRLPVELLPRQIWTKKPKVGLSTSWRYDMTVYSI
ncbi:hypothetical protein J6590_000035 [Homalodisca vitripennis]|nr:hypothetical protein J6590_000035 [Homalodisca vitripennis]